MPNWCYNSVEVTPLTPENAKILEEATEVGLLNTYVPIPSEDNENWYDDRCNAWGTKWDIAEAYVEVNDNGLVMQFDTAWSPPIAGIQTISKAYPDATFYGEYSEPGMCFAGEYIIKNGEMLSSVEREYDPEYEEE